MAENKEPTIEQQLAAAKAEAQAAKAEADAAKKALESATKTGIVSPTVPGTFSVSGKDASGKSVNGKYRFRNGRIRTPLPSGQQVPSAKLIELANGKKMEDIEGVDSFPWFSKLTQEEAQAVLRRLVEINAATIEKV